MYLNSISKKLYKLPWHKDCKTDYLLIFFSNYWPVSLNINSPPWGGQSINKLHTQLFACPMHTQAHLRQEG